MYAATASSLMHLLCRGNRLSSIWRTDGRGRGQLLLNEGNYRGLRSGYCRRRRWQWDGGYWQWIRCIDGRCGYRTGARRAEHRSFLRWRRTARTAISTLLWPSAISFAILWCVAVTVAIYEHTKKTVFLLAARIRHIVRKRAISSAGRADAPTANTATATAIATAALQFERSLLENFGDAIVISLQFAFEFEQLAVQTSHVSLHQIVHLIGQLNLLVRIHQYLPVFAVQFFVLFVCLRGAHLVSGTFAEQYANALLNRVDVI